MAYWQLYIPQAGAAIAAMREPTEVMVLAGAKTVEGHIWLTGESMARRYQAMVDAALEGETNPHR